MHYSVCIPAVLGKKEPSAALNAVKAANFEQYEIWSWWDKDIAAYQKAQQENHLTIAALCTSFIPLTDPARRQDYVNGLRSTIEVCRKLGCKTVISQVGQELDDRSREEQHESIAAGLRECVPLLKDADITLVIETLNTKIDHRGYYLWSSEEAFRIIDEVGDPHVKVLFDLYHQYIMNDLDIGHIVKNIDKIGHFHMAGYPGRHEPMIDSEIDYPKILKAISETGYQGSVGLEYFPVHDAEEGLKLLHEQLNMIFR